MASLHGERVRSPLRVEVAASRNAEYVDRRGGRGTRAPGVPGRLAAIRLGGLYAILEWYVFLILGFSNAAQQGHSFMPILGS